MYAVHVVSLLGRLACRLYLGDARGVVVVWSSVRESCLTELEFGGGMGWEMSARYVCILGTQCHLFEEPPAE